MELRGIGRSALLIAAVLVAGCSKKPTPESVPETQVAAEIDSAETDTVPGTLTDERDGKTYRTVVIGGKRWMAENMNYQPETGNSWCYNNDTSCCNKYGRLYAWNAAMKACPIGYHLPSRGEWDSLARSAGGTRPNTGELFWFDVGTKLKAKTGWNDYQSEKNYNGTDDYGFSAMPSGFRNDAGGFTAVSSSGNWWTATESNDGKNVQIWGFDYLGDTFVFGLHKSSGFPVRCVADAK